MRQIILLVLALSVFSSIGAAQYGFTATNNLPVANSVNDQAVPKLAARSDGGTWIAWFDRAGANYDVRLQRLDANGYELFPHNGMLVSGNPQSSSLVDWDLINDSAGNAVLTFTDTRAGGDLDVYAYRVSPTGTMLWGINGVVLSSDAHFEANPVVAEMTDGSFVFAWSRSPTVGVARLAVQKLDPAGLPQFGAVALEIFGGATDDPGFVGIVAALSGSYILSWIRDITPFTAPRHLWVQRYDTNGTAMWGIAPVQVYNAAALPIAYKPETLSDGIGGCWIAWHVSVGAFYQSRIQHLDANGVEVFAHNGVEISLEPNRSDFNPSVVPLAATGDVLVFYNKRDSAQAQWGIGGQRITSGGALAWGQNGIEFVPYDGILEEVPRAVATSNGAMCFVEQASGVNATSLVGFRVDANGLPLWTPTVQFACSTPSPKDKLRVGRGQNDSALLCWNDARTDINDVYAQNVRANGGLGAAPSAVTPYGCGINIPGSLTLTSGTPSIGTNFSVGLHDPTSSMAIGSMSLLVVSALPLPGFPCGAALPNYGMVAGSTGELLVDLNVTILPILTGPTWVGAPVPFAFALPNFTSIIGFDVFMQGALVDGVGRVGLSNGVVVHIGP